MMINRTEVTAIQLVVEPVPFDAPLNATQLLTQSRLETWNQCRRKHQYRYVDQYASVTEKPALAWGKAWHSFQEYWWAGRRDPADIKRVVLQPASELLDALTFLQLEELMIGYDRAMAARAEEFEVVWLEREFRAPLYDPSVTTENNARPIEVSAVFALGGKRDGLLRRKSTGAMVLKENKSTSQTIESDAEPYWDKLAMDHQLSLYTIGNDADGIESDEVAYDVVRKPSIRPKRGESMEEYRLRLRAEIAERPLSYFRWREIPRQTKELFHAMRDFWDAARLMEIEAAGHLSPRNPSACYQYGIGHACPYINVCLGNTTLDSDPTLIRMTPHQELEVKK